MNPMIETAMAWWNGREPRERWLLKGLGILVAGLVAWYGIWSPLQALAQRAEARHAEAAAALVQAESAAEEIAQATQRRGGRGPATAQALAQGASAAGVTVMKTEPADGGGLTLWTEPAEPKALFSWLASAQRELGVGVRLIEVQKEGEAVQARIVLDGAGA